MAWTYTESGNNTASTSWAVSHPAAATGDMLIFHIAWDDSTNTTALTPPSGPNGETAVTIVNVTADSGTNVRGKIVYYIATGAWTASTRTFTPSASEQWTAVVTKVPSGEYDATTPIATATNTTSSTGTTTPSLPSLTAGSTDGGGTLVGFMASDTNDPDGTITGWTERASTDRGAVGLGLWTRDTTVSNSESISAATGATLPASNAYVGFIYIVRPYDGIAVDASSSGSGTYVNSVTFSHTISGSDRLLVVGVSTLSDSGTPHNLSSVTYNGTGLTNIRRDTYAGVHTELWGLIAPDTGTHDIVITGDGSFDEAFTIGTAWSFTGADQSALPTSGSTGNGYDGTTGVSVSTTTTEDNQFVIGVASKYNASTTLVGAGGQTDKIQTHGAGWGAVGALSYKSAPTAGSYSLGYTWTGSYDTVMSTAAIKKAAGTVSVTGVTIDQADRGLTTGDTATYTATVAPSGATDTSVSWSSSATGVATVNSSGVVTAVAPGSTTITVTTTDGSYTDTVTVTVTAALSATFSWKGYTWTRRASGSGSPMYSGGTWDRNNVRDPDGSDYVKLKLTNHNNNAPAGGEMYTTGETFGYGTYYAVVSGDWTVMHKSIVWGGMFTYGTNSPHFNEMDSAEVSAWSGGPDGSWPRTLDQTYYFDNAGVSDSVTDSVNVPATLIQTHRMIWAPGSLTMESWEGTGTGGTLINSNTWTANVPTPYDEQVYFNVWVFDDSNHYGDPDGATPQDFTLMDFSFTPETNNNGAFLPFF